MWDNVIEYYLFEPNTSENREELVLDIDNWLNYEQGCDINVTDVTTEEDVHNREIKLKLQGNRNGEYMDFILTIGPVSYIITNEKHNDMNIEYRDVLFKGELYE